MTTRVQKGGPIFRPVTKPRPRQASATPDLHSSVEPVIQYDGTPHPVTNLPSSMPPPSAIPRRAQPTSHSEEFAQIQATSISDEPQSTSDAIPPSMNIEKARAPFPSTLQQSNFSSIPLATPTSAVPISVPSRRIPSTIATRPTSVVLNPRSQSHISQPNASAPSPAASRSIVASHTPTVLPPIAIEQPNTDILSQVTDAQIDPALLQAVVTALSHSNDDLHHLPPVIAESMSQDAIDSMLSHPVQQSRDTASENHAGPSNEQNTQLRLKRPRTKRPPSQTTQQDDTSGDSIAPTSELQKQKRRNYSTTNAELEEEEQEGESSDVSMRRSHSSSSVSRKRKPRAPSLPPYDGTADPGEDIDPTSITMAELCDDTGRGRVSGKAAQIMQNHSSWRISNKEKRARMRAVMEAKKYGRDMEEDQPPNSNATPSQPTSSAEADAQALAEGGNPPTGGSASRAVSVDPTVIGERGDDYDYSQAMSTSKYNVQIRIGPNGETIIDEDSLFVDRNGEEDTANYTHIEESDLTKFVNSSTYSKKLRGSRWSAEETELFYNALQQFGENYELISYVLPGRDRKACKNKFKSEDKRSPARITYCLRNRRPYDLKTLARMTGKDFSGPTPEIRAPTPIRLAELSKSTEASDAPSTSIKSKRRTTSPTVNSGDTGEEILGNIEELSKDDHDMVLS